MSRRVKKDKVTVRVPNPDAPQKGRLETPSHKVHRSKKSYRRKAKHQRPEHDDD
jgi:hypothetical protein